jgi:radical SAM superfamily enzyme YgiQ (UPF0313 family)
MSHLLREAEETWPRFLHEWSEGRHQTRYEQAERTDMATVPVPRLDLLRMKDYAFASVQFSRGCPFECEFCDIIVTFGRRPWIKTSAQVLAELDAIVAAGKRYAFIVDDNLIGNKKAIKQVLRDVVAWQAKRGYPLMFSTEASIDFAEDAELMVEANINEVFILIGETDDWNPAAACREMVAQPHDDGNRVDLYVYPGAHHGFNFRELQPGIRVLSIASERRADWPLYLTPAP